MRSKSPGLFAPALSAVAAGFLSAGLLVAQKVPTPAGKAAPPKSDAAEAGTSKKAAVKASRVDRAIPAYRKVLGIRGNLNSVGSDTLNNLMTFWAEGFRRLYPGVKIQIEGKGSSTAPPALIAGTAQLGPMSRGMKAKEIDRFEKKFGYRPTVFRVAIDALAVYVNKDNPISRLTLPELDAIFSKTRRLGLKNGILNWGQLGLGGVFARKPIRIYGRNSASGTYGYFKKVAMGKGDYRDTVKEQPGSASVVRAVTEDLFGIGYSGIGYKTSGVKALLLAKKPGAPYYSTHPSDVYSGKYPLARFLYIYVNKAPGKPLPPLVREFLTYVLSREGQTTVIRGGYLPLTSKIVKAALASMD